VGDEQKRLEDDRDFAGAEFEKASDTRNFKKRVMDNIGLGHPRPQRCNMTSASKKDEKNHKPWQ
jgi:hypothetical protein